MTHIHRWICEPGIILNCPARCACGETKVFPNASASQSYNLTLRRGVGSLSDAKDYSGYGLKSRGGQN